MAFLEHIPGSVPDGKMLVHNHVGHRNQDGSPRNLGDWGFRAWLLPTIHDDGYHVPCDCDWAPRLPVHYRRDIARIRAEQDGNNQGT